MKLRSRLILAFLVLGVLPLTVLVVFSYLSSESAVRSAAEAESRGMTAELRRRLEDVEQDVNRRVQKLGQVAMSRRSMDFSLLDESITSEMGEFSALVESVEVFPSESWVTTPETEVENDTFVFFVDNATRPPHPVRPPRPGSQQEPPRVPTVGPIERGLRPPRGPGQRPEHPSRGERGSERRIQQAEELAIAEERMQEEHEEALEATRELEEAMLGLEVVEQLAQVGVNLALKIGQSAGGIDAEESEKIRIETGGKIHAELNRARSDLAKEVKKIKWKKALQEKERRRLESHAHETRRVMGRNAGMAQIYSGDEKLGEIRAHFRAGELLDGILGQGSRKGEEIPFAFDSDGNLHVAEESEREALENEGVLHRSAIGGNHDEIRSPAGWIVVTETDEDSGLMLGIARPIASSLLQLRQTALRNLFFGLGLLSLALLGVLPLSHRLTRDVVSLTKGAEKIARGDLSARVPVNSRDELGTLAGSFNHMAEQLVFHQDRLVEQERVAAENRRRGEELEEARRFQLSLLPRNLPKHPRVEIAVRTRPATEVGGDYYDFHLADDESLVAAIGDATGHGARAGTMVTAVKSLFCSATCTPDALAPAAFLMEATSVIRRMDLGRMHMGLSLIKIRDLDLTLSSAGMPPIFVRRATGDVDEFAVEGMPLGGIGDYPYTDLEIRLNPGDTALLLTDGLPELADSDGEPFGYERIAELLATQKEASPEEVIGALSAAAEAWSTEPEDDMTFVVLKVAG